MSKNQKEIWRIGRCPGCTAWIIEPLRENGTLPAHDTLKIFGGVTCSGTGQRPYETMRVDAKTMEEVKE